MSGFSQKMHEDVFRLKPIMQKDIYPRAKARGNDLLTNKFIVKK
jgi:hypothetical protein